MASQLWSSVPWQLTALAGSSGSSSAWHKHHVPYAPNANALQTLDVWVPREADDPKTPPPDSIASRNGLWVIYIHGGAWRDPLVDSSSFDATVAELISKPSKILGRVSGFATVNYSLSIHPNHPTHPAPPKNPNDPIDKSRQAKHPEHIFDVLAALSFLQQKAGFGSNYILMGHSCGATLAFQVAMNHGIWGAEAAALNVFKPKVIVGLNGLYDMPSIIRDPGPGHEKLVPLYESFTRLAFGDDDKAWHTISPISVDGWASVWPEGSKVVLVQSKEDSLVPYSQLRGMLAKLQQSKAVGMEVSEYTCRGDHNELWQKGDALAEIVERVVESL